MRSEIPWYLAGCTLLVLLVVFSRFIFEALALLSFILRMYLL